MESRVMYNSDQKEEYIKYESKNEQSLTNYFKRIFENEKEYGKDIADMDEDELKSTLISLNIRREESRNHMLSLMRGYINWAKFSNKTNNNSSINNITPDVISSDNAIITQMLKSPKQVEHIINNSIKEDYYSQENRDSRDQLVLWLLYSGMTIEELQSLKKNDIDYVNKKVKTKDDIYQVNDKILALCEKCSNIKYLEKTGTKSKSGIINYDLLDNEYLFRPIAGQKLRDPMCKQTIFIAIIQKIFNNYYELTGEYIRVSPLNIKLSGIFYQLYEQEQMGTKITSEILAKYLKIEYSSKKELLIKIRKWKIDYDDWKLAFGYM